VKSSESVLSEALRDESCETAIVVEEARRV
jgi:hypothetical protein